MPNEMMNKENVVDIHKVLYLVLKNEVVAFSGKWMELDIMLSEMRRTEKDNYVFFHMRNLGLNSCAYT